MPGTDIAWELQVVLTQLQGLAEATGDAIGSGCLVYEIFGAQQP